MDIKVIVASHKKYEMPTDKMYVPVQVGAEGKEDIGFTPDNVGENISSKNPNFCELTGLYYAWKNIDCEYLGLAHYRRHFKGKNGFLTLEEAEKLFTETDVILPKKRNYYIESLYSHYEHTMYVEPLDIAGEIIKEKYPRYFAEFEKLKTRKSAHMFNMFIMKKEILNGYCEWLFDILFELENRAAGSQYDDFHARFYGRVSELLFDVYLLTNGIGGVEVPLLYTEKVNWWKKGTGFLRAKFFGEKYGKSF
ncbi:MAG: DUF4422 domain-containing protein [Clostridiales bacterium]|nr:DUF4422 domain-containing protein [Candidatus Equinaster intestinalis]